MGCIRIRAALALGSLSTCRLHGLAGKVQEILVGRRTMWRSMRDLLQKDSFRVCCMLRDYIPYEVEVPIIRYPQCKTSKLIRAGSLLIREGVVANLCGL